MNNKPSGEIILYPRADGAPALEVRLEGDTVWLTQQQLADLLQTSRTNVVEHIQNIYSGGELVEEATCREFRQVRLEGQREVSRSIPHYNLDMIISLGYRVRSGIATRFRIWATERLREYLVKGFTMDDARLKGQGGGNYWKELLERIRDIRSSEKVLYRQVLDLYATSIDYAPPERREQPVLQDRAEQVALCGPWAHRSRDHRRSGGRGETLHGAAHLQ
jgi:hypothetical protein